LIGAFAGKPGWLVNGHSARPANGEPAKAPIKVAVIPAVAVGAPATVPGRAAAPVAATSERDGVVLEYLRNMRSMVAAQRDVVLAYLGAPALVREVIDVPVATPVALPLAVPGEGAARDVGAGERPVDGRRPAAPPQLEPLELVVSIVSERTGYPSDTLGLDLDLEADLSIDSIKRIEIIGELAQRLGLDVRGRGGDADAIVEELATRKTLRALVTWLTERLSASAPAPAAEAPRAPVAAATSAAASVLVTAPPRVTDPIGRYRLEVVDAPLPINGFSTFAEQRFAICDDGRTGAALASRLAAEGVIARLVHPGDELGQLEGLIDLTPLGRIADPAQLLGDLFERAQAAALGGAKTIMIATGNGGAFGRGTDASAVGGAAGLLKTLAAEWPQIKARAVDFDPADEPDTIAERLAHELHAGDPHHEIGYIRGVRSTVAPVAAALGDPRDLPLDGDSVVLVTGGARGITARAAVELARRYRCAVELVGRSPLPIDEDPELASVADAIDVRKRLIERGGRPAEIEAALARVLADREIRATLAEIRAAGADVRYHGCDVRADAFGDLIDDVYRRRGRIDAVIHAAGILEDKLIKHKTRESFDRVVSTKLAGARMLARKLHDDVKLIVMFSSISGPFGNRGQVDYAAAGDALDKLAWSLHEKGAARVVSIDWGPWSGAGMVTPELAREYARRGIGLIELEAGVTALFDELARGGDPQVVISAVDPRAFVARPESRPPGLHVAAEA
jgi:NAD(P)-dependent dehydrogenase (short-subunit alcohol dehydrogenase family)